MFENIINDFKMSMKTKKGLFTTTIKQSRELIKCEIETECDKMTEIQIRNYWKVGNEIKYRVEVATGQEICIQTGLALELG